MIDWIFVALEETLHERFVHDRDRSGGLVVRRRKRAASQDRHAEVLQVTGADAVPRRATLLAHLGHQAFTMSG